ncbi:MAG: Hsp33 family molecular chaperone HslO [Nitrospirae bacterium]|nr:Hsp33 family molecular chaperone HslO [Nitrospirota bacterium]MCL5422459.1 Hsp33 family molecular chaperone HslO [Nitrospirota bacterium]
MDLLLKGIAKEEGLLVVSLVSTETVEKARLIHDTYPTATAAFGRVLGGALLLSSLLKEGQKVILQVSGDGPLKEMVAEADWLCRVRGYVKRPHIHLELKDEKLDVGRAVGKGIMHVIKDLGLREYYRGSVPLQTGEIATDLAYYLTASEQIPAAVSLGVFVDTDNAVKASGGFMIHVLPGATDETLRYLKERLKKFPPVSSMIREGCGPEEIMEKAMGLPVEVLERKEVHYYCPCSRDRVLDTLVALGEKDMNELAEKDERVNVQCRFCMKEYSVSREELLSLLKAMKNSSG